MGHDMQPQVEHCVLASSWVVLAGGAGCNQYQHFAEERVDWVGGVIVDHVQ